MLITYAPRVPQRESRSYRYVRNHARLFLTNLSITYSAFHEPWMTLPDMTVQIGLGGKRDLTIFAHKGNL